MSILPENVDFRMIKKHLPFILFTCVIGLKTSYIHALEEVVVIPSWIDKKGMIHVPGVKIGNSGNYNLFLSLQQEEGMWKTRLENAIPTDLDNQLAHFSNNMLMIDNLITGTTSVSVDLNLETTKPRVTLGIGSIQDQIDPSLTVGWKINYGNSFLDDDLTINPNGSTLLANAYAGSWEEEETDEGIQISLNYGLSLFSGRKKSSKGVPEIKGNFDHFQEQGTFTATPSPSSLQTIFPIFGMQNQIFKDNVGDNLSFSVSKDGEDLVALIGNAFKASFASQQSPLTPDFTFTFSLQCRDGMEIIKVASKRGPGFDEEAQYDAEFLGDVDNVLGEVMNDLKEVSEHEFLTPNNCSF